MFLAFVKHQKHTTPNMEKNRGFFAALLTIFGLFTLSHARGNSCAIYSGGCAFHIVLAGKNCPSRDVPLTSAYTQMQGDDPKAMYNFQTRSQHNDVTKEQLELEKMVRDELETNSKKLAELETKLTHMMEGLSVRSLRHYRKIKSDMNTIMSGVRSISRGSDSASRVRSGDGRRRGGNEQNEIVPADDVDGDCPEGFRSMENWDSCYKFSSFNATWNQASEHCSQMGANLVAIETEQEVAILEGIIRRNRGEIRTS